MIALAALGGVAQMARCSLLGKSPAIGGCAVRGAVVTLGSR